MTAFTLTIHDEGVKAALNALAAKVNNMQPLLQAIGDDITERAKHRFDTSSGPDGQPWKPNSAATLAALAARIGQRKGSTLKGGALNAQGQRALANKKPLIGESGFLRQQIVPVATGSTLTVSSTPAYAAIQQFGGKAGRGHKVTIPARPFMPVYLDGGVYPQEREAILAKLNEWLAGG